MQSLEIPVSWTGNPEPSIIWDKEGEEIETEDGTLRILVVTIMDEGNIFNELLPRRLFHKQFKNDHLLSIYKC